MQDGQFQLSVLSILLWGYVVPFMQPKILISSVPSAFYAQPSRLGIDICATMLPSECRTKQHENGLKRGKIAHNCSALPCKVICVAAQCRHAYSCNKIGRGLSISTFAIQPDFCVVKEDWRTWSFSFSNRHIGCSWGLHGQKRRIYMSRL